MSELLKAVSVRASAENYKSKRTEKMRALFSRSCKWFYYTYSTALRFYKGLVLFTVEVSDED